ncbi:hypothetical protein JG687_00001949 [Phytophthora cactorum]|uniref:Uncharacterized protein n=1 Tax=Phytophthora cactorum TaxID=29920 RepID=A0A8T1UZS8_9STRA|nr:hypothetical protein JG687_00001949 [Phytophthora cactorum]
MLSRLHASNPNVFKKHPTDENFCRVDTNSEDKTRSKLSSVAQPGRKRKMQLIPHQRPKIYLVEELKKRLK